jgi:DNA topoisomerase-1
MQVAQRLYEAGKITYMRTDSVNLSETAMKGASDAIHSMYGAQYSNPTKYTTKSSGAQEAHEAIRPTDFTANQNNSSDSDEVRLYDLIWKRAIASQMAHAELERTTINIGDESLPEIFQAKGEVIRFDGFLKVYLESSLTDEEDDSNEESLLPAVEVGEILNPQVIRATERFTRPPARYVEASLVKKLEELGIGRPSTYAPTISTIQKRGYVERSEREGAERHYRILELKSGAIETVQKTEITGREKNKLFPTDIGMVVTDFLIDHFEHIMDYHFTAEVEAQFDEIAQGNLEWTKMLSSFYTGFHEDVEETLEHSDRATGERILGIHPISNKKVLARIGRFGPMIQVGDEKEDGEKPQFASLTGSQSIHTITLEDALDLFKLPRVLGEMNGEVVKANTGRFGPYVQIGKLFVSMKKEDDPMTVTLERAKELIALKQQEEANKLIKSFPEREDVQLLNGRYGAYLKIGKDNFKLPKGTEPDKLTLEECIAIAADQASAPKKKFVRKKK